jgi:hypothetical protein
MAKNKATTVKKNNSVHSWPKLSRRNTLISFGILIVLTLIGWIIVRQHQRANAIQTQQQRFNTIHSVERSFETNVKSLLGTSLVDIYEESRCYNTNQGPWDNGELWCGVSVVGDTKELPSTVASSQGAWDTITQVDTVAHNEVAKSGVSYYSPEWSPGGPKSGDSLSYDDFFYLYGKKALNNGTEMRCDITGNKFSDSVIANGASGKPKQFSFKFSCDQRSFKTFYPFQAS